MNCPVCKAPNDGGGQCRRCRVDLSLLFQLDEYRAVLAQRAHNACIEGDFHRALTIIRDGEQLRRDADLAQKRAVCFLLLHDFQCAWAAYKEHAMLCRADAALR